LGAGGSRTLQAASKNRLSTRFGAQVEPKGF
jgi:hypothetical protein